MESAEILFDYVRRKRQEISVDRVCVRANCEAARGLPLHVFAPLASAPAREREEAEALLAQHAYDGAIIDLCLTPAHGADGLHVVAYARARSPSTRIVVLTAYGSSQCRKADRANRVDPP